LVKKGLGSKFSGLIISTPFQIWERILSFVKTGVADSHHFDVDLDPACHSDPDPAYHFDADADADPDPSFQFKAQNLEKVLK
jgi:hypothetical protein